MVFVPLGELIADDRGAAILRDLRISQCVARLHIDSGGAWNYVRPGWS